MNNNNDTFTESEIFNINKVRQLKQIMQELWTKSHNESVNTFGEKRAVLEKLTRDLQSVARSENISEMEKAIELATQRQLEGEKAARIRPMSATERVNNSRTRKHIAH